tara:strand:+ start:5923 stop:6249 length:327 start_codon:yes stop_codon:yes gene_type:complete
MIDNTLYTELNLKSGTNKGNRRIWIEGQALRIHGLTKGTMLSKSFEAGTRTMWLTVTDLPKFKKHSIAGTVDRPILDLCGKWVTRFMGNAERFDAVICKGGIKITPCE